MKQRAARHLVSLVERDHVTVLKILKSVRSSLPRKDEVLARPDPYGAPSWRSAFVSSESAKPTHDSPAAADVATLLETFDSSISRQELLDLATSDVSEGGRRRLWIATMMWGYGTQGLHWDPELNRIAAFLGRADLDERLGRCGQHLQDGDIEAAYGQLSGVAGIKSAV